MGFRTCSLPDWEKTVFYQLDQCFGLEAATKFGSKTLHDLNKYSKNARGKVNLLSEIQIFPLKSTFENNIHGVATRSLKHGKMFDFSNIIFCSV